MPSLNTTDDLHGSRPLFALAQDDGEIDSFAMILASLQSPLKKALATQAAAQAAAPVAKPQPPALPLAPAPAFTAAPLPQALFPLPLATASAPASRASSPSRPSSPLPAFASPVALPPTDAQGPNKKKRQRTSPDQLLVLEQIFETDKMPNQQKRIRLAEQLGMSSRRIQIWFQNKRAKVKRINGKQQSQHAEAASAPGTPDSGHATDSVPSSPHSIFSPPPSPGRDAAAKKLLPAAAALGQPAPPVQFVYHADPAFQLKDAGKDARPALHVPAGYLDARLLDSRLLAAVQEGQQAYPALDQLPVPSHHHFGFFHSVPRPQPQAGQPPAQKNCTASASLHASPLEHQQVLLSRTVRL